MTTNAKTWTPWLKNPGDGVCPVPEWAEDYQVFLEDGEQLSANENSDFSWHVNDPTCIDITHYRYAVPEDLAWLAREVSEWRQCISPFFSDEEMLVYRDSAVSVRYAEPGSIRATKGKAYTKDQWHRARKDLGLDSPKGKPSWDDAPEWAEWLAQDENGDWAFYPDKPNDKQDQWVMPYTAPYALNTVGRSKVHGDWRNTLERRPGRRQDGEASAPPPYIVTEGSTTNHVTWQDTDGCDSHYQHQYKGIKLDPYRIAKIYNMQGGPREQIMKKCLRFTDKDQTERQVLGEIKKAVIRWEQILEEDGE